MRLFIAIQVGEEVKRHIASLINKLRTYDTGVRWVRPENIHLTLKFLGEVEPTRVDDIKKVLFKVSSGHPCFELNARGTGVFPNYARPRVLWVGLEGPPCLEKLHRDLNNELTPIGFEPEERAFRPHLTIGRVKSQQGLKPLLKELRGYMNKEFGKITVNEVLLVKSTLKPEGAEYETVFHAPLKKEVL